TAGVGGTTRTGGAPAPRPRPHRVGRRGDAPLRLAGDPFPADGDEGRRAPGPGDSRRRLARHVLRGRQPRPRGLRITRRLRRHPAPESPRGARRGRSPFLPWCGAGPSRDPGDVRGAAPALPRIRTGRPADPGPLQLHSRHQVATGPPGGGPRAEMRDLSRVTAIAGAANTAFSFTSERSHLDLALEAITLALHDAGL